ncbi:diguanylate cyclase [Streptomyces sp. DSM 42041]|uniref:Diguanylate cyclase n=1 Tax=Streptomyces hazeniae TaxID=3075538 RepID=A0ABU2NQ00_9ACTN|nr:diguanylate cyclase [Streptomyces sp. DSM 42041]MDT0378681.1 diguanylate cyclase [Streptomyces sp. DSM 42041]
MLAAVCGAYATGAAFGWGSPRMALIMGDFGLAAAALLAAVSCFWYARTHRSGRFRPAWYLFALSSAMAALGNGVWGWYEVVLAAPVPHPSVADFCFLLFAPPAVVGLLVLAKRPVTRAGWVCLGLDAWLIGGSLLTVSWSLALAHTASPQGDSVAYAALTLTYPLLDIVLVSMVLALHFRRTAADRSAINTAIGALALTVLCDALFTSPLLREHYSSGQLLDAGWFAGSLLLAYAPWVGARHPAGAPDAAAGCAPSPQPGEPARTDTGAGRAAQARQPQGRPLAGSLAALTPYLAAAVCTLSIIYNSLDGRAVDRVVLLTGCTVVLALVVRQGIMLLDNITLTQELAQKENHFRSLVQGSSDVIMIAASTGVLRYVSPAAAGVYGRDGDQLVGSELASLIHPEDLARVLHEIRRFLAAPPESEYSTRIECRFRHGAGHWLNVESTVNRYQGGLILNSRDVTERVRLQDQLKHNASHDPLTDLPNRALFTDRVRQALAGRRGGDGDTAVLYIDLDGFKAVNDTVGHHAGDELLVQAAQRLRESVRAGDTAARLGGDEFAALILGDPATAHDTEARERRVLEIADRLRLTLSQPYRVHDGTEVRVAASIGVAFAESGVTPAVLLRHADLAMYRAKQSGKNRVELHRPQTPEATRHAAAGEAPTAKPKAAAVPAAEVPAAGARASGVPLLPQQPGPERPVATGPAATPAAVPAVASAAVRPACAAPAGAAVPAPGATRDGGFALLHQPVVELSTGRVTAVAAQPRWRSPQGILFTPGEYLRTDGRPRPERAGERAPQASRRLLAEAVAQAADRHRAGLTAPVTVRVSARGLTGAAPPDGGVEELLDRHGLPPCGLVLEISVGDPRTALDELAHRLTGLRDRGVRVALDGIGSGYAALAALRRLPLDVLCLDQGLVEGLVESPRLRKITSGLLRIADDLGLTSVADGVDLPEQVLALRAMGCTHGRGAAFSGALDEHRLRRALTVGGYPLPAPSVSGVGGAGGAHTGEPGGADTRPGEPRRGEPRTGDARGGDPRGNRPVVAAGRLPVRRGGLSGPDPLTHHSALGSPGAPSAGPSGGPPYSSHTETPVPPT